ncbi:MAG: hypothetical protein IPO90_00260 [Flavobacteriales bacterium]|nr:hypothetical protein [Flavobacteriales bacterium]
MKTGQLSWKIPTSWARRLWGTAAAALLLGSPSFAQSYCESDGGSGNTFNVNRVQFAGIDNTSGDNNGYADFTGLSATVDPGASYGIALEPNGPFFLRYRWSVWIDWNQDGAFTANERMVQQTGFGGETATIAVPAGALPGSTRMRVNMSAFSYRGACESWAFGEVEDYTVVVPQQCDAQAGTLTIPKPLVCFDGTSATLTAVANGDANVPAGFEVLYVLTSGSGLVIEQVGADAIFEVTGPGLYTIHTLVYNPATLDLSIVVLGQTTGFDVNGLLQQGGGSICASLDVSGGVTNVIAPNAGTLSGGGTVCSAEPTVLSATPNGDVNVPAGYSSLFVLTSGSNLVIEQVGSSPSFSVSGTGLFTIHTFVFPSNLDLSVVVPGVTTGGDVLALLAANNICASLDVAGAAFNVTNPDAGTLSGGADVCLTGDAVTLTATANGDSNTPDGYSLAYVLTSGTNLVIEQLGGTPSFEVTAGGLYTIHTFVFPSNLDLSVVVPGVTTGGDVLALLAANNICASLDVAGAAFNVTNPDAGTLSGGADVCLTGDAVTLTATANGDSNTPDGYSLAYVLTSGTNLVIEQLGGTPSFEVTAGGLYTIHTFVFPSNLDLSVVVPGVTTGGDVLALLAANNICASLDVAGAAFNVTNPDAGTLSGGGDVCLIDDAVTLTATANGDSNTPDGYSLAYVLTSGTNLVIEQLGGTPSFEVTAGGLYTIHTFVFPSNLDLSVVVPGVTTGGDVLALLAANNICASLDVAGAAFNVTNPDAGTLSGGADVCLTGDAVTLTATANGDSNTPDGYSLAYVLTSGTNLVIEQLGGTPSFEVTAGGLYTIHTFVFPSNLDLSVVVPGVTTGGDVLALLAANNICASLDVAGAAFNVTNPDAGTLSGGTDVCLTGDAVTLTATANGDSNTPDGYSLAYVLTSGTDLVIEQLGGTPKLRSDSWWSVHHPHLRVPKQPRPERCGAWCYNRW